MKIAHISDLHLNTMFNDSSLKRIKRIVKYISTLDVDHFVISGDLTDNADENDLYILKKLFDKAGFLKSEKLSLVPGNHDIFGGPQRPEDIFTFPERCKEINFKKKINVFNELFKETFEKVIYQSQLQENNGYPYAKIINDKLLLVGINSNVEYSRYKNPFASNGEVKLSQFIEIDEIFKKYSNRADNILVVIHHHFNKVKSTKRSVAGLWQSIEKQTMKLRKKKRLLSLFEKYSVDLVLHGHIHYNELYERNGLTFVNGGASISGYSGKSVKINIIDISDQNIFCELHKISEDGKVKIEYLYQNEAANEKKIKPVYLNGTISH